jgi:hypothetical protein
MAIDPLSVFDEPQQNAASPEQQLAAFATDQDAHKQAVKVEVIKALLEHERGREWIYDILVRCHIFTTPFAADPYLTAFNAGEQNIGNVVLADLVACEPDKYVLMCREGYNRELAIKMATKKLQEAGDINAQDLR